jgi:hypothetical protein
MARFKNYPGVIALLLLAMLWGVSDWSSRESLAQLNRSAAVVPVDFSLEVAKGNIPNTSFMEKFGENSDIDTGAFEVVWDAGGPYVPPTIARIHNVASDNAADTGTVLSSGTATGGSITTLEDTGATFITDTVAVGDLVLNDENVELGRVTEVTSETLLTMAGGMRDPNSGLLGTIETASPMQAGVRNVSGDAYRVVTDASTGASVFHIRGLLSTFLEVDEFVILNGVSNVATVNSYIRQYRARVFTTASTGAVGTITSTAQTQIRRATSRNGTGRSQRSRLRYPS